jgi:GT2 family glycosyltransferase
MQQTLLPAEILVVDDGNLSKDDQERCRRLVEPEAHFRYVKKDKPSLSASKNLIGSLAASEYTLIIDDDTVLLKDCVAALVSVFQRDLRGEIAAVGCAALNQRVPSRFERAWKSLFLLYTSRPGDVTPTMFEVRLFKKMTEEYEVKWLPGFTVLYRSLILKEYFFEEFFGGRNALEDLEHAIRINRKYKFIATPRAGVYHYRSPVARESMFTVGLKHAYNRCLIFHKYGRQGLFRLVFLWSFLGYMLGLVMTGRLAIARGNLAGLRQFLADHRRGAIP